MVWFDSSQHTLAIGGQYEREGRKLTITERETETALAVSVTGADCYRLRQVLLAAASMASTDQGRTGITSVHLVVSHGLLVASATDSYAGIEITMALADDSVTGSAAVLADARQLAKAAKLIGRKTASVSLVQTGHALSIITADGSANADISYDGWPASLVSVLDKAAGESFPQSADTVLRISPVLLSRVMDSFATALPADQPAVDLVAVGCYTADDGTERAGRAWLFTGTSENVSVRSAVMPLRT